MKRSNVTRLGKDGFALIVTIAMLVVMTVIAVGLLSLSTISVKSTAINSAYERAQVNARMALMMAIDQLQLEMGPDQRISANASILSESTVINPHWVGAWDSWIAGPLADARTNPNYPGSASGHQTIGSPTDNSMRPEYDRKDDYFRSWLVSMPENNLSSVEVDLSGSGTMPTRDALSIKLVAEGSLGDAASPGDHVSVPLVGIADDSGRKAGRYAYWVGDESQKASIMYDSYRSETSLTRAEKLYRTQAPAATGTNMATGLEQVTIEERHGSLPSRLTLDLLPNAQDQPARTNFHAITTRAKGVLADVREGGLKRDLNTILEQPIELTDSGDEYMLYALNDSRFPDRSGSRVPIQDLAAYYQMYDDQPSFANNRREGVKYNSSAKPNAIQLRVPDFDGGSKNRQRILREYTALYRQPVVTKVQFLVAVAAEPVTAEERQWVLDRYNAAVAARAANQTVDPASSRIVPMRDTDTHKLRMGIIPMVTLWNPNNLPLVLDTAQILRFHTPPFAYRFRKFRAVGNPATYDYRWTNLSYAAGNNFGGATTGQASGNNLLRLRFGASTTANTVFEPGEVKVFSLPASTASNLLDGGNTISLAETDRNLDTINSWDPFGFFMVPNSTPHGPYEDEAPEAYGFRVVQYPGQSLVFNPQDRLAFSLDAEDPAVVLNGNWRDGRYVSQAKSSDPKGSAFTLYFMDEGYQSNWRDNLDHIRHWTMNCRHGTIDRPTQANVATFNRQLITPGFPGGEVPIPFEIEANAILGQDIIDFSNAGEVVTLFEFSLNLGCELGTVATGGYGGGRRVTSRPFLHSPSSAAPFIDQADRASLYNYGWDWRINKVNTVEDSILQAKPGTGNGYYGGGYTVESGTTQVIQREIPVLPPISIAALSHAHLGGFSLGNHLSIGHNPDTDTYFKRATTLQNPTGLEYQRTTAYGQAGLAPHILQAIGNSYAHPNIPADKAFVTKERLFDADEGPVQVPFVDHSYLANKALWDDFFFSSITPQLTKVPLYENTSNLSAQEVARRFFFEDEPLPNRRFIPHLTGIDEDKLTELFSQSGDYQDGLADKIAAHLMVNGTFNINSTSVDAWKILLSGLRGVTVSHLNGGINPSETTPEGTVFGSNLPVTAPVTSSSMTDPNVPAEQWSAARELTDEEISELAAAVVKQVKLRGPFLSLSEFINRGLRGDSNTTNTEISLKGAMQAALDDDSVSINAPFRSDSRKIDMETSGVTFDFPEAATGPIAYGSAPYVDQADILRSFAGQLTPRGDTFVIRAYGDSLNAKGEVEARAWCEAVVQRTPEYTDPSDAPHLKQSELNETNKVFGRKFYVVSMRWLNSSEI